MLTIKPCPYSFKLNTSEHLHHPISKLINLNFHKSTSEMVNSHFGQSLHATENISGQRLQVIVSQAPNEKEKQYRQSSAYRLSHVLMHGKPLFHNLDRKGIYNGSVIH